MSLLRKTFAISTYNDLGKLSMGASDASEVEQAKKLHRYAESLAVKAQKRAEYRCFMVQRPARWS